MVKLLTILYLMLSLSCLAQDDSLYPLQSRFLGEQSQPNVVFKTSNNRRPLLSYIKPYYVRYLEDASKRSQFVMQVRDGRIYQQGRLFSNSFDRHGLNIQKSIFVLSQDNQVYFAQKYKPNIFHHSSLVSGESVKFAGEVVILDGEIIAISNRSGHYLPDESGYEVFKRELKNMGYSGQFPELSERSDITRESEVIKRVLERLNFCGDMYL